MKNALTLTTAALLAARIAAAEPELSGTPAELRQHLQELPGQVTISGLAERTVEADRAVVQISVFTSGRQFRPALEENNRIRAEIVASLADAGIAADRIRTARFASTPSRSSWTGKVKEYQVTSAVRVHAESEREIQHVAGLVDAKEGVSLSSLTFEMTKKEQITAELLKEAFQRVQERRELYESSLGVRLRPRQVGLPAARDADRRAQWLLRDGGEAMSVSGVLANPELSVVLHALEQRGPEISQFEELVYKVGIVVTFDLLPGDEAGGPAAK